MSGRLLLAAFFVACSSPAVRAAAPPPGKAIDDLVARLGHEEYDERERAQARLLALDLREPSLSLLRAAASADPEIRRRSRRIVECILVGVRRRALAKAIEAGKRGEIDLMIDGLFIAQQKGTPEEPCWRPLLAQTGALLERTRAQRDPKGATLGLGLYPFSAILPPSSADQRPLVPPPYWASRSLLEMRSANTGAYRLCVTDGSFQLTDSCGDRMVILANGNFRAVHVTSCLIVTDGDVDLSGADDSIIIARGDVRATGVGHSSAVIAGGKVSVAKRTAALVVQNDANPLKLVRFFQTPPGIEVVASKLAVRVDSVEQDKAFARAGLRAGDLIFEFDGVPLRTPDCFRRALRRQVVWGMTATLRVRREGKWVEIRLPLPREGRG